MCNQMYNFLLFLGSGVPNNTCECPSEKQLLLLINLGTVRRPFPNNLESIILN